LLASKRIPQPHPSRRRPTSPILLFQGAKRKKRKRGGQRGHDKHIRQPFAADKIDETIIHKLPDTEVLRRGLYNTPRKLGAEME